MTDGKRLVVVDMVGLTPGHVGPEVTPHLHRVATSGSMGGLEGVLPAVTCSAQATLLTGVLPEEHGIVGNGWFFRDTSEIRFWLQSNALIQSEPVYVTARRRARERGRSFTCAKLFWWYNQGAPVDWSVTPKPHYGADGSKEFDIYSAPPSLAGELEAAHGTFPFHTFWGPMAGRPATDWIARAAADTIRKRAPSLSLVYLPHLDYDLQRQGPECDDLERLLREVDEAFGHLTGAADAIGAEILVVSEYGLLPVNRVVEPNRLFRREGWLTVRDGPFGERIDLFASSAFAVCDHQIAHLYVRDPDLREPVRDRLLDASGVGEVLDEEGKRAHGLGHARAGELVALAEPDAWFAYPYWLDEARAPDFAPTVDIHRKPGYDPCELFLDPKLTLPKGRLLARLAQKKLGFRYRMDVVPLDPTLVRGSHGIPPEDEKKGSIILGSSSDLTDRVNRMTDLKPYILEQLDLG